MKRRETLRNVAATGAVLTGATSVVAATGSGDEKYLVTREDGQRVVEPLSEVDEDVDVEDHCHTYCCENCPDTGCGDDCVCEAYCYL